MRLPFIIFEMNNPPNTDQTLTAFFANKRFIVRNALVWVGLYGLLTIAQYRSHAERWVYRDMTLVMMVAMILFYGNFLLCHALFIRRKGWYFLTLACVFAGFLYGIHRLLERDAVLRPEEYPPGQTGVIMMYMSLLFALTILLSGFYWSALFAAEKIRENARMQVELQRVENEKISAEKRFLQSQINPHFLHNTLNFLYAKSLSCSRELSDGIMTLSSIMKYSLQKNENARGFVLLEDEVAHVQNVVRIHQLRYGGKLQINVAIAGDMRHAELLPFVLITLVENALKHGDWSDPACPIRISLLCDEEKQKICFSVFNKKREGPKEHSTGIGLENTISRLKWSYRDNYSLHITDEEGMYMAELAVPLYRGIPAIASNTKPENI